MPDEGLSDRPLLSLRGVTKRYGGVHALGGVDFALRAAEIHALLGENGAGKSMPQQKLAGRVGVTRQTIIVLEAGKYVPSLLLALGFSSTMMVNPARPP